MTFRDGFTQLKTFWQEWKQSKLNRAVVELTTNPKVPETKELSTQNNISQTNVPNTDLIIQIPTTEKQEGFILDSFDLELESIGIIIIFINSHYLELILSNSINDNSNQTSKNQITNN